MGPFEVTPPPIIPCPFVRDDGTHGQLIDIVEDSDGHYYGVFRPDKM